MTNDNQGNLMLFDENVNEGDLMWYDGDDDNESDDDSKGD